MDGPAAADDRGFALYVTRPTLGDYIETRDELVTRTGELFGWIADGTLTVRVGGTYRFADAAAAHEDLAGRRTTGKLLLTPDTDSDAGLLPRGQ